MKRPEPILSVLTFENWRLQILIRKEHLASSMAITRAPEHSVSKLMASWDPFGIVPFQPQLTPILCGSIAPRALQSTAMAECRRTRVSD